MRHWKVLLACPLLVPCVLGRSDTNWYYKGLKGNVPVVVVNDAFSTEETDRMFKFADSMLHEEGGARAGFLKERWVPFGKKKYTPFEKLAMKIAAIDLKHVVPEKVAKRIAGFSYRFNRAYNCEDARAHFDHDERTSNTFNGVKYVSPLIATVTYLTDYGAPTVVWNYTNADADKPGTLPTSGYMVMPKRGKHVAFDPRLLHAVQGHLRYSGDGKPCHETCEGDGVSTLCDDKDMHENRIILGMNYWEIEIGETLPSNQQLWPTPSAKTKIRENPFISIFDRDQSFEVIPADSDKVIEVHTKAFSRGSGSYNCKDSWKKLQDGFTVAGGGPAEDDKKANVDRDAAREEGEPWHSISFGWSRGAYPYRFYYRLPLNKEPEKFGATIHFKNSCEDVRFLHYLVSPSFPDASDDTVAHKHISYMMRNRCEVFGYEKPDVVPYFLSEFCPRLTSKKLEDLHAQQKAEDFEL